MLTISVSQELLRPISGSEVSGYWGERIMGKNIEVNNRSLSMGPECFATRPQHGMAWSGTPTFPLNIKCIKCSRNAIFKKKIIPVCDPRCTVRIHVILGMCLVCCMQVG